MTTIEEKIKLFSKIVNDKISEEKEKEFDNFQREKEEILAKEKQKLEIREKQITEDAIKRANIKSKELLAKAKLEKQRTLLNLKKQFLDELVVEVEKRLKDYAASEEYRHYLLQSIKNSAGNIENGTYVVYLTREDITKYKEEIEGILSGFPDKYFEIRESSKDLLGGVIVEDKNCRFRIDNSLSRRLHQLRPYIGAELMEKLA